MGIVPDLEFHQESVVLKPNDTVVMYTDGVNEAMNRDHEEFGNDRLLELFAGKPPKSASEADEATFAAVANFVAGAAQSDDITCLTLFRRESKP